MCSKCPSQVSTVAPLRAAVAAIQMSLVGTAFPPCAARRRSPRIGDSSRRRRAAPGPPGCRGTRPARFVAPSSPARQEAGTQLTERDRRHADQLGPVQEGRHLLVPAPKIAVGGGVETQGVQRQSSSSTASNWIVARSKSRNSSSLQPPARRPSPLERAPSAPRPCPRRSMTVWLATCPGGASRAPEPRRGPGKDSDRQRFHGVTVLMHSQCALIECTSLQHRDPNSVPGRTPWRRPGTASTVPGLASVARQWQFQAEVPVTRIR